ncbi:MAG: PAS domain S-box protein [Anaerolineae bacterium]
MTRVCRSAREILAAHGCAIYLLEADQQTLTPTVVIDPPFEPEVLATPLRVDASFTGQAVLARCGLIFNDAAGDTRGMCIPGTSLEPEERVIAVPFVADGQVIGAMCLNRLGRRYDASDLALAETFAMLATTALRNAQLHQELERQVAERVREEDALRARERLYHALFEQAGDATILVSPDGKVADASESACTLLGYTRKELLAMSAADVWVSERGASFEAAIEQLAFREPMALEGTCVRRDGTFVQIDVRTAPVSGPEGNLVLAVARDISEFRRAEATQEAMFRIAAAALASSSEHDLFPVIHASLAELLPARNCHIALYDEMNDMLVFPYWVSEVEAPPLPNRPQNVRGLSGYVARRGTPLLASRETIAALAQSGEIQVIGAVPVEWLGVPLRAGNHTIGVLAVQSFDPSERYSNRDVELLCFVSTQVAMAIDRAKALEAVRTSERRFRSLIENGSEVSVVLDRGGHIRYECPTIKRLFGYEPGELYGASVVDLLHPEDRQAGRSELQHVLDVPRVPSTFVSRMRCKDGGYRSFELVAQNLCADPAISGVVVNVRDVTERQRVEQEREHLIQELRESLRKVRTLSGLLPICAACKKIRDDSGYWQAVEVYIRDHSEAELTHSICPDCMKKLYGSFAET